MGLLDGLEPPVKRDSCRVRTILESLEKKDQEILNNALADEITWKAKTLSDSLKQRGLQIVDTGISRHRRQLCSCFRSNNA